MDRPWESPDYVITWAFEHSLSASSPRNFQTHGAIDRMYVRTLLFAVYIRVAAASASLDVELHQLNGRVLILQGGIPAQTHVQVVRGVGETPPEPRRVVERAAGAGGTARPVPQRIVQEHPPKLVLQRTSLAEVVVAYKRRYYRVGIGTRAGTVARNVDTVRRLLQTCHEGPDVLARAAPPLSDHHPVNVGVLHRHQVGGEARGLECIWSAVSIGHHATAHLRVAHPVSAVEDLVACAVVDPAAQPGRPQAGEGGPGTGAVVGGVGHVEVGHSQPAPRPPTLPVDVHVTDQSGGCARGVEQELSRGTVWEQASRLLAGSRDGGRGGGGDEGRGGRSDEGAVRPAWDGEARPHGGRGLQLLNSVPHLSQHSGHGLHLLVQRAEL